jgi:hypothetical protein
LHCLIAGNYLDHSKLSDLWCAITKGSTVVDIRAIRDKKATSDYVARYSSRPTLLNSFNLEDRLEVFYALHGRRLCGTWGVGSDCRLSVPRKPVSEKWVNVGSWRSVVLNLNSNSICRSIFNSWKSDCKLQEGLSAACLDILPFDLKPNDLPSIINYSLCEEPPP